jgi:hypothetical protein
MSLCKQVLPQYAEDARGYRRQNDSRDNFDAIFTKYPETLIFGEDAGQ